MTPEHAQILRGAMQALGYDRSFDTPEAWAEHVIELADAVAGLAEAPELRGAAPPMPPLPQVVETMPAEDPFYQAAYALAHAANRLLRVRGRFNEFEHVFEALDEAAAAIDPFFEEQGDVPPDQVLRNVRA